MRVLGLCSYPAESAATRFRLAQFVEPLAKKNINLEIKPFLDSRQFTLLYDNKSALKRIPKLSKCVLNRFFEISQIKNYDLLFVQREAMFFGPAFFEWAFQTAGNIPLILDLDDATYIPYTSPTYGKISRILKFFGKTDKMIKRAKLVICGNRFIADYVRGKGVETMIIPTVVDTDKFVPVEKNYKIPVIGWIGTHSTFPLLESIFPVLRELSRKHQFTLKIIGAGRASVEIEGVNAENTTWHLEREVSDFQSLDIGLYPIVVSSSAPKEWLLGKSGFKAVQYMAVGVPFVMTPLGVCGEIGDPDVTHFNAVNAEDWYNALDKLLSDVDLRKRMGENAREHSLRYYTLTIQAEKLAETFRKILSK